MGKIKEKITSLWQRLGKSLSTDDMFYENEKQANQLGALILLLSGIFLLIIMFLTAIDVFPLEWETIFPPAIQAVVEILILLFISYKVRKDAWWLKYLLMIGLVIVYARLDSMLTHKAAILMVLPVIFSSRFFSRKLTIFTALFTTVSFFFSAIWGAVHGMINLNIVTMPPGVEIITTGGFLGTAVENVGVDPRMLIRNTLLYDYLPKLFMFSIAAIISINIVRRGREMVIRQHEKDIAEARIEYDLNLAARIQANMLPDVGRTFPDRKGFDVCASMTPARNIGGDFYDFTMIDEDHLFLAIADVSGKGISAALLMMASMIFLSSKARAGKSPGMILEDTNNSICSRNKEEMFITVWLGILELSTGRLTASNAGHEYPVLRRPDGKFELLKDKHNFVVGGMDGVKYNEYELLLEPGTTLFLYTDGVVESTDKDKNLFGTERMLDALNEAPDSSPEELLDNVRSRVDQFVNGAEQFDDLTMLCFAYKGYSGESGE